MNKLTKEEVRHVASLARLYLDEKEEEKYSKELYLIMNEINRVKDLDIEGDSLIAPKTNDCKLRKDNPEDIDYTSKLIENAPKSALNYIEVAGVFDE